MATAKRTKKADKGTSVDAVVPVLGKRQPKPKATGTVLAVQPAERSELVLPGEAAVDEALVAQGVQDINAIYRANGLATARAVGEYVVAKFFGGDLDYAKKKHGKHVSFTALGKHADLAIGRTTLWYWVSVLGQLRQLPDDIAGSLSMSHHTLLLTVKDPAKKLALAKEAVTTGVGKRKFEVRVRQVRDEREPSTGNSPGRPPLPAWAKGIGSIKHAIEAAMAEGVTADDVVVQGPRKIRDRMAEVNEAIGLLEAFKASLTEALAGAAEATATDELAEKIWVS
jgi:hypothetical protein